MTNETFRTIVSSAGIAYLPEHLRSSPVFVFFTLVLCLLLLVSLSFLFRLFRCYLYFCEKHLLITPCVTPNFPYLFRKIYIWKLTNECIKNNILIISEYGICMIIYQICVLFFVRLLILSVVNTHYTQWWMA